jgi:hypothetical protein
MIGFQRVRHGFGGVAEQVVIGSGCGRGFKGSQGQLQ